jgi:uncharacterized membrane protein
VTTSSDRDPEAPAAAMATGPAASPRWPWQRLASTGNLDYDRVLFFSDAIFAIAITLLVVDIRVPVLPRGAIHAAEQLRSAEPQMVGFGISFAVIGLFWIAHHTLFRHIVAFDRTLIWLNLLFLGTIAFLPYPTSLLSATSGDTAAVVFYATCCGLAGLAESAVWIYACRAPGLLTPDTSGQLRRYYALRALATPAVFLLSIPVAFRWPSQTPYGWISIVAVDYALRHLMLRNGDPRDKEPV